MLTYPFAYHLDLSTHEQLNKKQSGLNKIIRHYEENNKSNSR
jgi:hypothetical protein